MRQTCRAVLVVICASLMAASPSGGQSSLLPVLGQLTVQEPLGVNWPDE